MLPFLPLFAPVNDKMTQQTGWSEYWSFDWVELYEKLH